MSRERFYITTAIDYANGRPHIGHALEKIGADVIARYHRLNGKEVRFVMGMDEHGAKVAESAAAEGIHPQQWTDGVAEEWKAAWAALDISYDDFIRTTETRHRQAVAEMIRRMREREDLYLGTYAGYYCVGCEAYKSEEELDEAERCPIHPTREIQWMEEQDWFFRLSAYQDRLLALLDDNPDFIQPRPRRNEVRRMIEQIKDISVSRAGLDWGIPWPDDSERTVYVWIDALTNYLSALGFPSGERMRFWPADLHVIGKDITRFHCVYWPAMLMSAGVEPPRQVWAHGFITIEGRKISKSEGTFISPAEAADRFGTDALRYYLLREVPWEGDGNFSWDRFAERYTAELANDLGNLASRTLSMIERYRDGVVPEGPGHRLGAEIGRAVAAYRERMDRHDLQGGLVAALDLIRGANGFVEKSAPWKLAKEPATESELDEVLAALTRALATSAVLLTPFMPGRMGELWRRCGFDVEDPGIADLDRIDPTGNRVEKGTALFPRETI